MPAAETNPVIQAVEDFIRRMRERDVILKPKARTLFFRATYEKTGERRSLSDWLSIWISNYEHNRNNPELKLHHAEICLLWINRAYTHSVVAGGPGLTRKLRACQDENKRLRTESLKTKQDLDKLRAEKTYLQGEYDELDRRVRRMLPSETGPVEN